MQCSCLLRLLPPLLVLAACGPDQPPTEPSPPAGPGGSTAGAVGHETVTSLADPGDGTCNAAQCTLREAINAPGSSEISFASGLTGTITLAAPSAGGGLLEIGKALTITGPAAGIVVQRRSVDPEFRILRVGAAGKVTLSNLTLRNGKTDGDGGGIINFGTLVLDRCMVADNSPNGIGNHGTLTLEQATVRDNSPGSGIFNHNDDTLTISESMVARNAGSGIFNLGGTIALTGSTVARNGFGGIYSARGLVTITEARIVDNSTPQDGGGILVFNAGLTLRRSTVARNSADNGGGIANHDGGETVISRSTIVANSAAVEGGGILNTVRQRLRASVTITNSTISGNSAGFFGGGVANGGFLSSASLQLTNSTVVRNSAAQEGGGLFLATDESVAGLVNTIVAQNSAPTGPDVRDRHQGGSVASRSNLIGDGTGSLITNTDGNQVGNVSPNSSPIDPRIGPLADNGGPTRTHALLAGSPAIDAASSADCPATDQRGVARPQGAGCDIGSYERK